MLKAILKIIGNLLGIFFLGFIISLLIDGVKIVFGMTGIIVLFILVIVLYIVLEIYKLIRDLKNNK
jgi:ABC-type antimicrobial peptide transport system permease subunit